MSSFPKIKKKSNLSQNVYDVRNGTAEDFSAEFSVYYVTFICCRKWLLGQKLTWRFRLLMGHFCWTTGNIYTQHSCKLVAVSLNIIVVLA